MNQKENNMQKFEGAGDIVITDLLADLFMNLAQVCKSFSRITQTCLGLKGALTNSQSQPEFLQNNPNCQQNGKNFVKEEGCKDSVSKNPSK